MADNFSPVKSLFDLKFGHSVALHGSASRYNIHNEGQLSPDQVRPKSKLIIRSPSSPCFVPDLDAEMVQESRNRRYQVHSAAMTNPQIFRRLSVVLLCLCIVIFDLSELLEKIVYAI